MKNLLIISLLLFQVIALAQTKTLLHKEVKRKYIIYTPKELDPGKSYPVVFNFHGGGMTPAEQMLYTGFNRIADKYGFIVVYPRGIKEDWNVGFGMSYKEGTDDIGFTESLLNQIQKDYKINPKKVYATGLSRGGFFCHRIAAELPHRFSAIATVGSSVPDSVAIYNKNPMPVKVLLIHGTDDKVVDYAGKHGGYFSAMDSYKFWKNNDALEETITTIDRDKKDITSLNILTSGSGYTSLLTVVNGGHTWPGADDFNIGLSIGLTSKEININEYIWNFFERLE